MLLGMRLFSTAWHALDRWPSVLARRVLAQIICSPRRSDEELCAVNELKRVLRTCMLAGRAALAPEDAAACSEAAQGHVQTSSHWAGAETVMLYMPIRAEMDTGLLLARAWAEGKRVLLPRCVPGRPGELDLVACAKADELAPGVYGILEPLASLPAIDLADPQQAPQLLLVPCLAVDRLGYRLGYGGGYYDRLLSLPALRGSLSLGFIFGWQLVASLPVESWDVCLKGMCTEQGLSWL